MNNYWYPVLFPVKIFTSFSNFQRHVVHAFLRIVQVLFSNVAILDFFPDNILL